MSRRTSEASKAIREAWENEQKLVSEGTGTRDWTQNQQKDILERGKAYDIDGRAFEGQHMRSAEMHPECQGDSKNIQFLTREEHLAAHDGDWRNPTNWYYNPVTKEKKDFGDGPIVPCEIIVLTEPLKMRSLTELCDNTSEQQNEEIVIENVETASTEEEYFLNVSSQISKGDAGTRYSSPSKIIPAKTGLIETVKKGAKAVGKFLWNNRGKILAGTVLFGGAILKEALNSSNGEGGNSENYYGYSGYDDSFDSNSDVSTDKVSYVKDGGNYPDERQSPRAHDVSGYTCYRNGKEIHVDPYRRGGKNDE